jgi:hypothetical protein
VGLWIAHAATTRPPAQRTAKVAIPDDRIDSQGRHGTRVDPSSRHKDALDPALLSSPRPRLDKQSKTLTEAVGRCSTRSTHCSTLPERVGV